MAELIHDSDIIDRLRRARIIAVLGAAVDPHRPAHYVPEYLHEQGYRIIPVNPAHAGSVLFGEIVRRSLGEIAEPVDIVDVFRRAEALPEHIADILAMAYRPGLIWFQLGIRNDEVARALSAAGVDVVQDRCTLAEHRRHGLPRLASARRG